MTFDFHYAISAAVKKRLQFIEAHKESLVEAWIAQHGFKPDESCMIIQDDMTGTVRIWIEKRKPADAIKGDPEQYNGY